MNVERCRPGPTEISSRTGRAVGASHLAGAEEDVAESQEVRFVTSAGDMVVEMADLRYRPAPAPGLLKACTGRITRRCVWAV